jgi:hypothetical protein
MVMPTPRKDETYEEMIARHRRDRTGGWKPIRRSRTTDGDGNLRTQSITDVPARDAFEPLPDATLGRRSTLTDAEGNVIQTWHIERPNDKARFAAWQEMAKALAADLPKAPVIPAPTDKPRDSLTIYPVGDHHLGMLAWKHEVGASYDLDIGEQLLTNAVSYLVNKAPRSKEALICFLGDYTHYDSMISVTPEHRNQLDGDGRAAKMVRVAMRTMRRVVERVAEHHEKVRVIIEFGNHDPYGTLWLMEAFRMKYEDTPRITVDCAPGFFHYYRFGSNLIGTNHGDRVKLDRLPQIMADDRPKDWGNTTNRMWLTGHVHHHKAIDIGSCSVESFRILPPGDAWAHSEGHRAKRQMQAIVLHPTDGEAERIYVNPAMVES